MHNSVGLLNISGVSLEIMISDIEFIPYFLGVNDRVVRHIRDNFDVIMNIHSDKILVNGVDEKKIFKYIESVYKLYENKIFLKEEDIIVGLNRTKEENFNYDYLLDKTQNLVFQGKILKPKGKNQKEYLDAIQNNEISFGVGPAGTGKTYLAVAMAVNYFNERRVERIVLTRPAVEAGESLGYLPGDLKEKIDPYLRPLYDALFELMGYDKVQKNVEKGLIEIAPLAYMRGRTLNNSFIILDEAQNTTLTQMKMFLTRFGFNSKAVITGDITQIDLKKGEKSGLIQAIHILKNIKGINISEFRKEDVVRHRIVKEIIKAYESMGEEV